MQKSLLFIFLLFPIVIFAYKPEDLKKLRKKGHKLILWTCRRNNKKYPALAEAINWCKKKGLIFDTVNKNVKGQKKISGYSPKVIADIYIDDKCVNYKNWKNI